MRERKTISPKQAVEEYINKTDWRIKATANQGYSLPGLILNAMGKVSANYWLDEVYTQEIGELHRNGDIHIHDLDMLSGYCAGWSLRQLLEEGLNGVPGRVELAPPKHFKAAINQMVNFLNTMSHEWAGAQAFSSFDTYLAAFVKVDNLSYDDVKQGIQEFVFTMNMPTKFGGQCVFSNLTFDITCPDDLKEVHPLIGGEEVEFTYADCIKEMEMVNKAYIDVMTSGDAKGRVFTFPIPTYNITKEFDWDSSIAMSIMDMTAKYGLPYFQNFMRGDLKPTDVRSMCCRLRLDIRELLKRGNGLFGSAEKTGSIGVVTINMARLGYLYKGDEKALYENLEKILDLSKDSLEMKRAKIEEWMDGGLFPYSKRYLGTLRNHFSTIGVNGINEMIRNFTDNKEDITTDSGKKMAEDILIHIRDKMSLYQGTTGNLYNLEATPAEGTTYRFAKEDKKRHRDIIQAGTKEKPYYTNSSQLPVGHTDDPFAAMRHQNSLQTLYTGGTVLHLYLAAKPTPDVAKSLIRKAFSNFDLPYITITPTFSICPEHGYIAGEHPTCPICAAEDKETKCEVWTRVMGYHRPVENFNIGKQGEFEERKFFGTDVPEMN